MSTNNRLILELDKTIRELNREVLNPAIPELTLAQLRPVIEMAARARARYLRELLDLSGVIGDAHPTADHVARLRELRAAYEELVNGARAMETAIQRGYLDVQP